MTTRTSIQTYHRKIACNEGELLARFIRFPSSAMAFRANSCFRVSVYVSSQLSEAARQSCMRFDWSSTSTLVTLCLLWSRGILFQLVLNQEPPSVGNSSHSHYELATLGLHWTPFHTLLLTFLPSLVTMTHSNRTSISSRERNRIHARKTRQRKKEQMQTLQAKADALKEQQLRLRQTLNEKHTASILLGLFGKDGEGIASVATEDDPKVEELLRRPPHEIPDSTKIPELPALILPGQHASKKAKATASSLLQENSENVDIEAADDGIDYELLGKDRSKCTPEELDQIRRERNRMHAKRTRDRKRLFMEEMSEVCRQLQEENNILFSHLRKVDPDFNTEDFTVPSLDLTGDTTPGLENTPTLVSSPAPSSPNISILNQITTLLEAAEATDSSGSSDEEEMQPIVKRRRL